MALAGQREYPFDSAPLGYLLCAGRMVSAASSAADGRGPRRNLDLDPAAAVALGISPRAPGELVFVHVPAGLLTRLRLFEICRAPVARNLDAASAVRVGAGLYELFWVGFVLFLIDAFHTSYQACGRGFRWTELRAAGAFDGGDSRCLQCSLQNRLRKGSVNSSLGAGSACRGFKFRDLHAWRSDGASDWAS
jgi:hypothetical protein